MMVYVWLGVLAASVILEIVTTQLVSVWFAIGALAAFLISLAGVEEIWIQLVVFVIVSAIAVAVTRPLVRKLVNKKAEPTNADMVIGKIGVVTDKIDNVNETGLVKVCGSVWTARTLDGSTVDVGGKVKILQISGVKLIVEKSDNI